jgi:NTE family protein
VRGQFFAGILGLGLLVLGGCASIHNNPVNLPTADGSADRIPLNFEAGGADDSVVIGLAFSGGGTRAAAYAYGVVEALGQVPFRNTRSMMENVEFVSGVSGGSVAAAYLGLRKPNGFRDFRERFLLQNAEADLQTSLTLGNIVRGMSGGVNDSSGLPRWLDANLFNGATMGDLRRSGRPRVFINASDIYNRTPFIFDSLAFNAICSDLSAYPLSEAVGASAAVPVAFAPVVIQTFPKKCEDPLPAWAVKSSSDTKAPVLLRTYARALVRYREGAVPYIKLLDGGLVDNFGLSGFTMSRMSAQTAHGPLTARQGARLRRLMFLIVDARTAVEGSWIQTVEGPSGAELASAVTGTAIDASAAASSAAFRAVMTEWQSSLVGWRCGLSAAERAAHGLGAGWNCRDLKIFVGRVGFDDLPPEKASSVDNVPTRFRLPPEQVDAVIAAGRETLRSSPTFKAFLQSL